MKRALIFSLFLSFAAEASFVPKSFSAVFVQEYLSTIKKKVKKSEGTLDYKSPGKIKLEYEKPRHLLYVSNLKKTWQYNKARIPGQPGQVTIGSSNNNIVKKIFEVLRFGLTDNKYYKVKKVSDHYSLKIEKDATRDFQLKELKVFFKGNSKTFSKISKIVLVQMNSQEKTLHLNKIELNKKFSKGYFTFVPPKNAKVSKF